MTSRLQIALLLCLFASYLAPFWGGAKILAQSRNIASIKIDGPCINCGADRINDLLKGFEGIQNLSLDPVAHLLTFEYDASVSLLDVQLELSIHGYDAGDFKRSQVSESDPCCKEKVLMRVEQSRMVLGLDEAGPMEEEEEDLLDLEAEMEMLEEEGIQKELDELDGLDLLEEEEDEFEIDLDNDDF